MFTANQPTSRNPIKGAGAKRFAPTIKSVLLERFNGLGTRVRWWVVKCPHLTSRTKLLSQLPMRIENKKITSYNLHLKENYRPPSKGGNTNSIHQHVIEIDGEIYSFLASGSQQLVFKSDTVSFEYEINKGYKNVIVSTIETKDRKGQPVVRGSRRF